jgi:hypothetical protein
MYSTTRRRQELDGCMYCTVATRCHMITIPASVLHRHHSFKNGQSTSSPNTTVCTTARSVLKCQLLIYKQVEVCVFATYSFPFNRPVLPVYESLYFVCGKRKPNCKHLKLTMRRKNQSFYLQLLSCKVNIFWGFFRSTISMILALLQDARRLKS